MHLHICSSYCPLAVVWPSLYFNFSRGGIIFNIFNIYNIYNIFFKEEGRKPSYVLLNSFYEW